MRHAVMFIVALAACAAEPDHTTDEAIISKVVVRDIPIVPVQPLTWSPICFETALPQPYDCTATMIAADGAQELVPSCEWSRDVPACWQIALDPMNCPNGAHEHIEIVRTEPASYAHHLVIECVSY